MARAAAGGRAALQLRAACTVLALGRCTARGRPQARDGWPLPLLRSCTFHIRTAHYATNNSWRAAFRVAAVRHPAHLNTRMCSSAAYRRCAGGAFAPLRPLLHLCGAGGRTAPSLSAGRLTVWALWLLGMARRRQAPLTCAAHGQLRATRSFHGCTAIFRPPQNLAFPRIISRLPAGRGRRQAARKARGGHTRRGRRAGCAPLRGKTCLRLPA